MIMIMIMIMILRHNNGIGFVLGTLSSEFGQSLAEPHDPYCIAAQSLIGNPLSCSGPTRRSSPYLRSTGPRDVTSPLHTTHVRRWHYFTWCFDRLHFTKHVVVHACYSVHFEFPLISAFPIITALHLTLNLRHFLHHKPWLMQC